MGEFELIERFFLRPVQKAVLGVGDDCALLQPAPGMQLAISSDMLVEGRHFLSTVDPARLGHKALAVNLSDLAACGAKPLAFTLALALPRAEEAWLAPFAQGLLALADAHLAFARARRLVAVDGFIDRSAPHHRQHQRHHRQPNHYSLLPSGIVSLL